MFLGLMRCRLRPTLNLRGPMRPSSWSVSMPCVEMPDSPLHRIQILHCIIWAVDGLQNVLWWALALTLAIVGGGGEDF